MILGYTIIEIAVALIAGIIAIGFGVAKRPPSDVTLGGAALIEVLLIAQLVISIVAPGAGNPPSGSLLEFYAYLISALLIPPFAVFWALVDRTRWSTVVVGVACLAIAVMLYRMEIIWTVQSA